MKSASEDNTLPLPPALLAQVQAAAEAEHRPTREIFREAVEHYLKNRDAAPGQKRARADVIRELLAFGKGRKLEGMSIREMIDEGRRF
jgi:predicted transcriptional regulator